MTEDYCPTCGSRQISDSDHKRLDDLERKYHLIFKDLYEFRIGIKRLLE